MLAFLVAVALVCVAAFVLSYRYFQSEEFSKAQGRLSLYQSTVVAELERFSHLTFVLSQDPFVRDVAAGGSTDALNQRLAEFADRAGIDAIYLMDRSGQTISASNAGTPTTFLGQNYGFRPYFQDALNGTQGRFYGIGATTGLPGYFIADAVRDDTGAVRAVIALKIDLSKLAEAWRSSGEAVFLSNRDGVVILASDPAWQYRVMQALPPDQRASIDAARQFRGQPLDPLDWVASGGALARLDGQEWLHLQSGDLPHDWALHFLTSTEPARARAWLVTASLALLGGASFIAMQIMRSRRMGVALRKSEQEEAALRAANDRLAVEIEERRAAERQLHHAQGELERTSRLAALGQLAASVTHELGQPIAAMRNQVAAAEIGQKVESPFAAKIGGLVDRMEGITRQLKFFARSETEPFRRFDLRDAVQAAITLLAPNVEHGPVTLRFEAPAEAVEMRGVQLRIEQVLTNLLRNAIDAAEGADRTDVTVTLGATEGTGWINVHDTGPGFGDLTLEDLQEPFFTTRESGRGMGLGLAISASIVKDHGGRMTAQSTQDAGTTFRLEFPLTPDLSA
ncbi:MAG: sensor histidine kinase [Rhodobacteraceae bacterium]|nr:sensor histidine kinase [Paracoccaceae bacterium]